MNFRSNETKLVRFFTSEDEAIGPPISVPIGIKVDQLATLLNFHVLKNEEKLPYSFFLNDQEIQTDLQKTLETLQKDNSNDDFLCDEVALKILYQPQAIFKVRSITHCSSSLPGHTEAVLSVCFSPNCERLASASGDTTIRLWEVSTETPYAECRGHSNWVLMVSWSPDGKRLASGSMDKTVRLWDPDNGKLLLTLQGHSKYVTSLSWEPLHVDSQCRRLVSGSKDGTSRVWDVITGSCLFVLTGHAMSVTCVKWGGEDLIYTSSQDCTIRVWSAHDGRIVHTLKAHGHWVNSISLNTDYVLRTGAYDHTGVEYPDPELAKKKAYERWIGVKGQGPERLASGSDDFTVYLWEPLVSKDPKIRMTGHARLVNVVSWSPDGNYLVSASFDKNIKLWNSSGKYLGTFRGHVGELYQISWAADSRIFVSGSKDSTLKVWEVSSKRLKQELPGHADEVYAVDWSPDGLKVASGSKDRTLKLWKN